jgi:FAD:protein FMN transferase
MWKNEEPPVRRTDGESSKIGSHPRTPGRREFLALGAGAFVVAALPFVGRRTPFLVRRSIPSMGTMAELGVVHGDRAWAHRAMDAAVAELRRVEAAMTRFRPDSEVGRVNLKAGAEGVAVSAETARVVAEALRWAEATEGKFDPSIGRAVALWNVGNRDTPPDPGQVRALARRGFYRHVDVARWRDGWAIRLGNRDAALDLGGIAKGYGVDRATATLREWGVTRGLVNVGGDLYALGTSPEGGAWRVGIRDPDHPDRLRGTLDVEDAAVATSGDYQEYFDHEGIRYHHLLDPTTAAPLRNGSRSITVIAKDCLTADAAATAIFGLGVARGGKLLRQVAPEAHLAEGSV